MLVVLSEFDNLGWLNSYGVYPDEYFTDVEVFQKKMLMHENADIVAIFSGFCSFRRRAVCDILTRLRSRSNINSVVVLSDGALPMLDSYYKFKDMPTLCTPYSHWKKSGDAEDILAKYRGTPKKAKVFLQEYKSDGVCRLTKEQEKEEELRSLIKVPEII